LAFLARVGHFKTRVLFKGPRVLNYNHQLLSKKRKKMPFQILESNEAYQKASTDLASAHVEGLRYETFSVLEQFVCQMYGFKNSIDINTARLHKFCSTYKAHNANEPFKKVLKNYDASNLSPCTTELHKQLLLNIL
jgi:hypothetical protein